MLATTTMSSLRTDNAIPCRIGRHWQDCYRSSATNWTRCYRKLIVENCLLESNVYVVAVLSKWRQFVCDAEHAFAEQCACKTTIRFSLIRQHTRARTHRLVAFSFFVHSYSIHIDVSEGLLYKSIILNGSLSDERFFFIKKKNYWHHKKCWRSEDLEFWPIDITALRINCGWRMEHLFVYIERDYISCRILNVYSLE